MITTCSVLKVTLSQISLKIKMDRPYSQRRELMASIMIMFMLNLSPKKRDHLKKQKKIRAIATKSPILLRKLENTRIKK
jgi:hypothetical protein